MPCRGGDGTGDALLAGPLLAAIEISRALSSRFGALVAAGPRLVALASRQLMETCMATGATHLDLADAA
jgi:hypothetical protein